MIRVALLLCILPFTVLADVWPTLHSVEGVSANDTLNVRAEPSTSSDVIDRLPSNQENVEVVAISDDGKWGQINVSEQSGWVSLRYLSKAADRSATQLPMACFGTEPFWTLDIDKDGMAVFENIGSDPVRTTEVKVSPSQNRTTNVFLIGEDGKEQTGLAATYRTQICNDGMTDRTLGISIDVLVAAPVGEPSAFSGCCTLVP